MIRRSLLAMIGMAPAAAAVSAKSNIEAQNLPRAFVEQWPLPERMNQVYSPLDDAKQRLSALQWARDNDLEESRDRPYEIIIAEVGAMRSWSTAYRARCAADRTEKMRKDFMIIDAIQHVEREIKLSLVPSWMRRFL